MVRKINYFILFYFYFITSQNGPAIASTNKKREVIIYFQKYKITLISDFLWLSNALLWLSLAADRFLAAVKK
jgi:hypothetical protein